MNKKAFLASFDELLERDPGATKESDELASLSEWNSLTILGFIAFADENFGVILSPADISKAKTVKDLISLLGNNIT